MISPVELDDLVRQLGEIYTHLNTNARHLAAIEKKAERLKVRLAALLPEPDLEDKEEVKE